MDIEMRRTGVEAICEGECAVSLNSSCPSCNQSSLIAVRHRPPARDSISPYVRCVSCFVQSPLSSWTASRCKISSQVVTEAVGYSGKCLLSKETLRTFCKKSSYVYS